MNEAAWLCVFAMAIWVVGMVGVFWLRKKLDERERRDRWDWDQ